ncbi:VWA domain-containing protein [Nocardioides sp. TRM66260-LWL]|uniref:vWA domain-containing protein n=1 Tax=Nocardioides sp. TRM66260-LWL TaxID=2874478 RepID=UPI001CC44D07|nr:VWA domain-containing protein [Nocardioides sp. TRM66260-LWL]MBZ5735799.1 VWA domain-containing protein [Nocardioides sp. TRM66260-LWL]
MRLPSLRRDAGTAGPGPSGDERPRGSGLLERHVLFVEALRGAGLPVSLAEDLDAIAVLRALDWDDRAVVREGYAAALVKRHGQRPTFDTLFDLYFPRVTGSGGQSLGDVGEEPGGSDDDPGSPEGSAGAEGAPVTDNAAALEAFREQLLDALLAGDEQRLQRMAAEMVARFGAMPGRGPGLSSWSAYTALQRVAPQELTDRIVAGLLAQGRTEEEATRAAGQRVGGLTAAVEADARRRIAEEKGPDHLARVAVRPTLERLDFLQMRRTDLEQMRREIHPLARRLATRLTQQHAARRRGPLDFRRTVRASMSTGGVPLTTHHRPKRPHRSELVVLCDVSGSVAHFAQFTLLLVFALRDQFQGVRAFTFIDHVHEVTPLLRPGADLVDVMADLSASTAQAALWGRTNYGRAFTRFAELHPDAIGPKTSLLVLGDARSNYSDLALDTVADIAGRVRHAHWLNPEHRRQWDTGDSAAGRYAEIVPMVECRNLAQLSEFVRDLL